MIAGLSLFANVGIAETYLSEVGIDIVVANELLAERCRRYQYAYPSCHVIAGDITDPHIYQEVRQASLDQQVKFLLATPPCQGMSIAGKMDAQDPRNTLIIKAIDMISDLQVDTWIIENVPQVLKTYLYIDDVAVMIPAYIDQRLGKHYEISYHILDTADYGTPQHRKRAIILGSRVGKRSLPSPTAHITVAEAIGHLPSLESGEGSHILDHYAPIHNPDHIRRMKHTPSAMTAFDNTAHFPCKDGRPIKGFRTTYKRMSRDKPAPTITMANGSISSQNNVHPGRLQADGTYSDARVLTLKELYILTGLPETWQAPPRASSHLIRKVIGEGIPPLLIAKLCSMMPSASSHTRGGVCYRSLTGLQNLT